MKQTLTVSGLVSLVVASLLVWVIAPENGKPGKDGVTVGALSTPSLGPWFDVGGVRHWGTSMELRQGNKTVCSVQGPAATSSLIHASLVVNQQDYATTYEIGIAASATATTTRVAIDSISANTWDAVSSFASSTPILSGLFPEGPVNGAINIVVGPHQYVNVNVATGTVSATFDPVGHCNIMFREL
jgi:hypothetical protein